MANNSQKRRFNIGIDARLFGTAQSTGIGTYTEELIGQLLKADTNNRYTVFAKPETVQFFPFYSPNLDKKPTPYPHYTYGEQFLFPRLLMNANLDLIHYTNFNTPIFFRSIKSIVTIHDLTLWFFPGRKQKSWFRKRMYRYVIKKSCQNATRIIAVSQHTKEDIIKNLGIPADKISVVHEAVASRISTVADPKKIEALKVRYDINRPFFMYVGNWLAHKNLVRLIRAFALFRHRYELDYQLVLVGKIDPVFPEIQATINQLNLQHHVVLTGYVADNDLGAFFSAAQAFVFPSLYEGFGLPPLEAMMVGTPVIASNASCLPEVLGDAALYFDPLDIEDIASKMQEVASSYHLRKSLKEKGQRHAKQYSFARMAKETLAVYETVLANQRDRLK